jgi:hypothetical protein
VIHSRMAQAPDEMSRWTEYYVVISRRVADAFEDVRAISAPSGSSANARLGSQRSCGRCRLSCEAWRPPVFGKDIVATCASGPGVAPGLLEVYFQPPNCPVMIGEIYTVRRPMPVLLSIVLVCIVSSACRAAETENVVNPPPTAMQWADLGKLPDWSGVWTPLVRDQEAQVRTNPPPWTPKASAQVIQMFAEEKAGRPRPLFVECLPEGMPSWMLITHNALEFLFTPGRVTVLGESDGNRLRRIYTDGRPHPNEPDPTFHGHSIGHWEGATLVVDTVGILPQSYLAVSEAVGVPNNGDMHVIERIHLQGMDFLHDDLEIIAPRILTTPWKTTRIFFRQRERKFEFVEGNCLQESFVEGLDKDGNAAFIPVPHHEGGNLVAPK